MGYNTIGPLPIASFNTTFTDPLKACECTFQASQASGTPTPANPISIVRVDKVNVTRCGKNLFDLNTITPYNANVTVTKEVNKITVANTNGYPINFYYGSHAKMKQGTYTVSIKSAINVAINVYKYLNGSLSFFSTGITVGNTSGQFTILEEGEYILSCNIASNTTISIENTQIELGSTATSYEPYNGVTKTINLGGTYYGGSVDCVTGKITLTHKFVEFDGSEDESWSSYAASTYFGFAISISDMKSGNNQDGKCNFLKVKANYSETGIRLGANNNTVYCLHISDTISGVTDVASWRTYLSNNPLQIVYPIDPIVVYASNTAEIPTINGLNQVFADTGDVTVTYRSTQEFYKVGSIFVTANSNVNVSTESGELASFNTPLALPLVSLKASIVATESGSGTKSPTNPYTLGGFSNAVITRAGKNLFNFWKNGYYTDAGVFNSNNKNGLCYPVKLANGQSITLFATSYISRGMAVFEDKELTRFIQNKRTGNPVVYTAIQDCWVTAWVNIDNTAIPDADNIKTVKTQLELGSTATAYEPYTETAITLALGQTVYGGEIVLTKKASGYGVKMRVTKKKIIIDGSQTISVAVQAYIKSDACDCFITVNDIYPRVSPPNQSDGFAMCDKLLPVKQMMWNLAGYPNCMTVNLNQIHLNIANDVLGITDYTQETTATAKAKITNYLQNNPIEVIYSIEPLEIDLTDASDIVALVGTNNVWSDTGDMEVQYKKII